MHAPAGGGVSLADPAAAMGVLARRRRCSPGLAMLSPMPCWWQRCKMCTSAARCGGYSPGPCFMCGPSRRIQGVGLADSAIAMGVLVRGRWCSPRRRCLAPCHACGRDARCACSRLDVGRIPRASDRCVAPAGEFKSGHWWPSVSRAIL